MNVTAEGVRKELIRHANPEKAVITAKFFKTGEGEYAFGDRFIGLNVPTIRSIAKKFELLSIDEAVRLLHSDIHEERLCALIILVNRYKKAENETSKEQIFKTYMNNTKFINNWDLVDTSAEHIVGAYLADKNKDILKELANSKSLWERRIAILATFHFIKNKHSEEAIKVAEILLHDRHDLIHKAVGWMLREIGKKCSKAILINFLNKNAAAMPRTTLRYAIEHLSQDEKNKFMNMKQANTN